MKLRVAIIGPLGVGKSSILRRLKDPSSSFIHQYHPTKKPILCKLNFTEIQFDITEYVGLDFPEVDAYLVVTTASMMDATQPFLDKIPPSIPYCLVINKSELAYLPNQINCSAKKEINLFTPLRILALKFNIHI